LSSSTAPSSRSARTFAHGCISRISRRQNFGSTSISAVQMMPMQPIPTLTASDTASSWISVRRSPWWDSYAARFVGPPARSTRSARPPEATMSSEWA